MISAESGPKKTRDALRSFITLCMDHIKASLICEMNEGNENLFSFPSE